MIWEKIAPNQSSRLARNPGMLRKNGVRYQGLYACSGASVALAGGISVC